MGQGHLDLIDEPPFDDRVVEQVGQLKHCVVVFFIDPVPVDIGPIENCADNCEFAVRQMDRNCHAPCQAEISKVSPGLLLSRIQSFA